MSNDVKGNIKSQATWKRGLYMIFFFICARIAEIVLFAVALFQFLLKLITGNTIDSLHTLGQGLSTYLYQIYHFLSFNTDYHPYPFGAWPKSEPKFDSTQQSSTQQNSTQEKSTQQGSSQQQKPASAKAASPKKAARPKKSARREKKATQEIEQQKPDPE